MNFQPFDKGKMEEYAAQAREKWGRTDAYREYERKTAGQSAEQMQSQGEDLMDIFRQIGQVRHLDPDCSEVRALIASLQRFITEHYYTCTPQILRGLGQMYIAGDSMTENIDKAGGVGTAEFTHRAIEIFVK